MMFINKNTIKAVLNFVKIYTKFVEGFKDVETILFSPLICLVSNCSHCGWLLLKCSAIGIGFNVPKPIVELHTF